MILEFIKLNTDNQEHLQYTYRLLKQRFKFPNTVVGDQQLPSFKEHVFNLKNCFIDFRLIYFNNIRLGIVALNKNYSLTHNYDFNSIKKNIKHITRKHFEVSYAIISQYINLMNINKCYIKMNPANKKALTCFMKMLDENKADALCIESIQLNIKYEQH